MEANRSKVCGDDEGSNRYKIKVDQLWVQSDRRRSGASVGGRRTDTAEVPCVANMIIAVFKNNDILKYYICKVATEGQRGNIVPKRKSGWKNGHSRLNWPVIKI